MLRFADILGFGLEIVRYFGLAHLVYLNRRILAKQFMGRKRGINVDSFLHDVDGALKIVSKSLLKEL
jgi:hypothetical protein